MITSDSKKNCHIIGCRQFESVLAACLLSIIAPQLCSAQLPAIELRSLSQPVGQTGSSFVLTPGGSHLDELDSFSCSSSGVAAEPIMTSTVPTEGESISKPPVPGGSFDVTISPNTPTGLCEFWFQGRFGMSNPRRFLVTKSPVARVPINIMTIDVAHPILPGTIYSGETSARQFGYLKLNVEAGQSIHSVMYARQCDSRAIPTMVLVDSDNTELARTRAKGDWPAEISHTVQRSGDYYLKIYDFLYRGGPEFGYLLQYSLSTKSDDSETIELDQLLRPTLDADVETLRLSNPARLGSSARAALSPEKFNTTSNHEIHKVPVTASGSLNDDTSIDFSAEKGQSLWIELTSSQLSQLTDPVIKIFDASSASDATPLVYQDDRPSLGGADFRIHQRDPYFSWAAKSTGNFRVEVTDNNQGKRPFDSVQYRLQIREAHEEFSLLLYPRFPNTNLALARPRGINLLRGSSFEFHAVVVRKDGFNKPLVVELVDSPKGITSTLGIIPKGASEGSIILEVAENAPEWTGEFKFRGRALGDESFVACEPLIGTVSVAATPVRNSVSTRLSSKLLGIINAKDLAPIQAKLGNGETIVEAEQGTTISLPLKILRREGGTGECLLRPKDLPPRTSLGEVKIAADKDQGEAKLKIAEQTPIGEYTFWLQNETKVKWKLNPEALDREQAYLDELVARKQSDAPNIQHIEQAIEEQQKRVETVKKETSAKDYTLWTPTNQVRIRVVAKTAKK